MALLLPQNEKKVCLLSMMQNNC